MSSTSTAQLTQAQQPVPMAGTKFETPALATPTPPKSKLPQLGREVRWCMVPDSPWIPRMDNQLKSEEHVSRIRKIKDDDMKHGAKPEYHIISWLKYWCLMGFHQELEWVFNDFFHTEFSTTNWHLIVVIHEKNMDHVANPRNVRVEVSSKRGTPSHYLFLDGIVPYKPSSYWGSSMTMEHETWNNVQRSWWNYRHGTCLCIFADGA